MENQNQRKRQLDDATEPPTKMPSTVKLEPIDNRALNLDEFPVLTAIISAPKVEKASGKEAVEMKPAPGYPAVYNAFRQFLQGYVAAGGDARLAGTLANYAAALPVPMVKPRLAPPIVKQESVHDENLDEKSEQKDQKAEPQDTFDAASPPTLASALAPDAKPDPSAGNEVTTEIQRLREAAFGRYRNVLCVICNEWICSRNRKNHIEAHLNYRPYKCSSCDYSRRREIFVIQHIKTHHQGQDNVEMITNVDLNISLEVDRLANECVERTRKLIDSMQEKKDGDFGEGHQFDEKALELMLAEEQEKKVVVIESVSEVRVKVANYHRRQRTKVLKKIYDTDAAKQTELKIVKDEEGGVAQIGVQVDETFGIKFEELMQMVKDHGQAQEDQKQETSSTETPAPMETETSQE